MGWNWRTFSFSGCQKNHKGQKLASYPAGNHDYIEHCQVLWLEFHFETYTLNLTSSKLSPALWQQHGDHSGYLDVSCTHLWQSHLCSAVLLPLVVLEGSVWWYLTLLISLSHKLICFTSMRCIGSNPFLKDTFQVPSTNISGSISCLKASI